MLKPCDYMNVTPDDAIDMWTRFDLHLLKPKHLVLYGHLHQLRECYLNELADWSPRNWARGNRPKPHQADESIVANTLKHGANCRMLRNTEREIQRMANEGQIPPHLMGWVRKAENLIVMTMLSIYHPPFSPTRQSKAEEYYASLDRLNLRDA